jgi:hypothetical protein
MQNEKEKILNWLAKRDLIAIARLEKKLGMKGRFLNQVLKRQKSLPDKYIEPMKKELRNYGYKSGATPLEGPEPGQLFS